MVDLCNFSSMIGFGSKEVGLRRLSFSSSFTSLVHYLCLLLFPSTYLHLNVRLFMYTADTRAAVYFRLLPTYLSCGGARRSVCIGGFFFKDVFERSIYVQGEGTKLVAV